MTLAEQHQTVGSSGAGVEVTSKNDDNNLSSVHVHREQTNDHEDSNSKTVARVSSDQVKRVVLTSTSSSSEDDEETESMTSGSSVAEDEDVPMDELGQRGWIDNAVLESEVNGIALPASNGMQIGKIHATNAPNLHIGQRVFIKSKGDLIIKSVRYTNAIGPEDQKASLENGSVHAEKNNNGIGNFESAMGPKLSNAADTLDNPLYASSRGKVSKWLLSKRWTITICIAALILLITAILCIWFMSSSGTTNTTTPPFVPGSPNDTSINNDPTFKGVRIVSRVEWIAQPPVKEPMKLEKNPPPYVIISHTATTFCYTQAQCVLNIRFVQTFHIESKGWDDIAYNFLVGGDGNVYEGRGWGIEGSHTFNYNVMSIGISFIGTFNSVEPTKAQLHAAKKLIELGVKNGYISKDYKLLGHRQCVKTESPGEVLYNIIRTWDHWSPTP